MSVPPTMFVAAGAVLAALVAGFFSFLNLVSSKENKVSEFRLSWIDGLREEIATFTAAMQELVRAEGLHSSLTQTQLSPASYEEREITWLKETRDAYLSAVSCLTRIQLRLNPQHVKENPMSHEAKLMENITSARTRFNAGDYNGAFESCELIRESAVPLLKITWDLVKNGEPAYRKIRTYAERTIIGGIIVVAALALAHVWLAIRA